MVFFSMESNKEIKISGKKIEMTNPGNPPPVPKSRHVFVFLLYQKDLKKGISVKESNTCFL